MDARTWLGLIATWAALVFTAAAGGCQGPTAAAPVPPPEQEPAGEVTRSDEAPCDASLPSHPRALALVRLASAEDCVARA